MTIRGKVSGGVVVLEKAGILPEGTVVQVEPICAAADADAEGDIWQKLAKWGGKAAGLPADLARNHDHYLHGTPKR